MTNNQIQYWRNVETERTNRANEGLRANELAETKRHNVTSEEETARHNLAGESETNRHNLVTEGVQVFQATSTDAHYRRQDANATSTLAESIRHNQAAELETNRHNVAAETNASGQLSESIRHNMATEKFSYDQLAENIGLGERGQNFSTAGQIVSAWIRAHPNMSLLDALDNLEKRIHGDDIPEEISDSIIRSINERRSGRTTGSWKGR